MNLKEKMAEIAAKASAYTVRIDAGESLSETEMGDLKGLLAEARNCSAQLKAAEDARGLFDSLSAKKSDVVPTGTKAALNSLGHEFVRNMKEKGRSLLEEGTFTAPEFKAAPDVQTVGAHDGAFGPLVTDIDRGFVLPYQRPLLIADLFASGTCSGNAIQYPVFGAMEGAAGFVAEGAAKPQVKVNDPTWVTDALTEIAGWFTLTDTMAEDIPYVASEINSTLVYDMQLREELALLSGDGTANSLTGILNRGILTHTAGVDSNPDAVFKATTKIQQTSGFSCDALVINPIDYQEIRLDKDNNGQYYGGGFFAGQYGQGGIMQNPPLWGLRTVVTPSIAAGTVLVGAFSSAKVFRKGGIVVESTNSHSDNFTMDRITIRAKERLGLQVKYPSAFCKIVLGSES